MLFLFLIVKRVCLISGTTLRAQSFMGFAPLDNTENLAMTGFLYRYSFKGARMQNVSAVALLCRVAFLDERFDLFQDG